MKTTLTVKQWLEIPRDKQQKLMEMFRFSRSSPTEVVDNVVISDGVSAKDLEAFNLGAMIAYLGPDWLDWATDELFNELLTLTLNKIYGRQPERNVELFGEGTIKPNGDIENRITRIIDNGIERTPEVVSNSNEGTKPRRAGRPRKAQGNV